ncbi:MAG: phage capsid protein [Nitrospirales bacterium]
MSIFVPTHFVQEYKTIVELLLQQMGSRFRDKVSSDTYTGKAGKAIEQVGAVAAIKKTSRHADTPLISTPADARWVFPQDYEWADLIDQQDKVRMLIDPTSSYAINGAHAIGRAMDDEIIAAAFATSLTGENGTTTTPFPAGQQAATTAGGLTTQKLREAMELLMAAEIDTDREQLWCAISARQHNDLLGDTQAPNRDFNAMPILDKGRIRNWMGFNFVLSERLPITGTDREVICWVPSGLHLGMWEDLRTEIDRRPDKSYATQVYVAATIGATRTQEQKVVRIICSEA